MTDHPTSAPWRPTMRDLSDAGLEAMADAFAEAYWGSDVWSRLRNTDSFDALSRAISAAWLASPAKGLVESLEGLPTRILRQMVATRGYLINNGIDAHLADVLLSHYGDFAREIEAISLQGGGERVPGLEWY